MTVAVTEKLMAELIEASENMRDRRAIARAHGAR